MTMPGTEGMLRVSHVVGSRLDPVFHDRIHALEHQDAVDVVVVHQVDLARRRFLATSRRGVELAIALPREERLFDGAILLLEDSRAIVVRSEAERWLRLEPRSIADAIELGYQAGNLHWRVRFDGDAVGPAGRPAGRLCRPAGGPDFERARQDEYLGGGYRSAWAQKSPQP